MKSNIHKRVSAVRVWKPLLDHRGTSAAELAAKFHFLCVPSAFMCYVSTQRRPIGFPPCMTDLWAALACLWDATVLERKKTSLVCFAVTQQERVLQCSTKVQLDRRWSYTFQSLKQLADILPCQLSPVLYVCSVYKNLPGGRKGGSTMLSHCCNLRASVRTCKTHTVSSWLLDHLLQDSSTPWINE